MCASVSRQLVHIYTPGERERGRKSERRNSHARTHRFCREPYSVRRPRHQPISTHAAPATLLHRLLDLKRGLEDLGDHSHDAVALACLVARHKLFDHPECAHRVHHVARVLRVAVHLAVHRGCGIATRPELEHLTAAGVPVGKLSHVVRNPVVDDEDLRLCFRLLLKGKQRDARQRRLVRSPIVLLHAGRKGVRFALNAPLLHLELRLLPLSAGVRRQLRCESEEREEIDDPFRGIVLPRANAVAVIVRELVVVAVVSLAEREERRPHIVLSSVLVGKCLRPKRVRGAVDEERRVLRAHQAEEAAVDEPTQGVAPTDPRNQGGEEEASRHRNLKVVPVLEADDGVGVEVADVRPADARRVLLHEHPPKVGVPETLVHSIGVLVRVRVLVVCAVVARPPADGTPHVLCVDT
eukprot:Opistho-1_new@85378